MSRISVILSQFSWPVSFVHFFILFIRDRNETILRHHILSEISISHIVYSSIRVSIVVILKSVSLFRNIIQCVTRFLFFYHQQIFDVNKKSNSFLFSSKYFLTAFHVNFHRSCLFLTLFVFRLMRRRLITWHLPLERITSDVLRHVSNDFVVTESNCCSVLAV